MTLSRLLQRLITPVTPFSASGKTNVFLLPGRLLATFNYQVSQQLASRAIERRPTGSLEEAQIFVICRRRRIATASVSPIMEPLKQTTLDGQAEKHVSITSPGRFTEWKPGRGQWLIFLCLAIISLVVSLDSSIIGPALPVSLSSTALQSDSATDMSPCALIGHCA